MAEITSVLCRRSNRGVPHTIYKYRGLEFSVCYFGNAGMYRIWLWKPGSEQKKLIDVGVDKGGSFDLAFVLDGVIDKYKLI